MTAEKVEIVKENATTYGLNTTLDAIGLPKSTWYYRKDQKRFSERIQRRATGRSSLIFTSLVTRWGNGSFAAY